MPDPVSPGTVISGYLTNIVCGATKNMCRSMEEMHPNRDWTLSNDSMSIFMEGLGKAIDELVDDLMLKIQQDADRRFLKMLELIHMASPGSDSISRSCVYCAADSGGPHTAGCELLDEMIRLKEKLGE
jgi:hypothetical protein